MPSTNFEAGEASSGVTGCREAEVPVCTLVLRLVESVAEPVTERVEAESGIGGRDPACASVLRFDSPVSSVAKGGRGGASSSISVSEGGCGGARSTIVSVVEAVKLVNLQMLCCV
jgi:hypothetical protein